MVLRDEILREHSKAQCEKIVKYAGNSKRRFNDLLSLFLNGEYSIIQRAAWPLTKIARQQPALFQNHFNKLALHANRTDLHPAVRRNITRIIEVMDIPENDEGEWMDLAFIIFLADIREAIAVKAHCIGILANLSKKYPEIIPEIRTVLAAQRPTPALRARINAFEKTVRKRPAFGDRST